MEINIDKNLVTFTPANETEVEQLQSLWNVIVDCQKFNKKLVPVGEFVPQKEQIARFAIEE